MNRRLVLGALLAASIVAWILLAPVIGLPFGVIGATGDSMGDEHAMMFAVWVDLEPDVGDELIFEHGGGEAASNDRFLHRAIEETDDGFVTQGDGNAYTDQSIDGVEYATPENTIGVVLWRAPVSHVLFGVTLFAVAAIVWEHRPLFRGRYYRFFDRLE